jgi:hypothetical protein
VDAVTQTSNGFDMVFAIGGDGRLEKYVPSSNTWYFLAAGTTFGSFSAGLDTDGYADVFMISSSGDLEVAATWNGGPRFPACLPRWTISTTRST